MNKEKEVLYFLEANKFPEKMSDRRRTSISRATSRNGVSLKWGFILINMHLMEEQDLSGEGVIFKGRSPTATPSFLILNS
ncbi:MAG: hypothetical protein IJK22_06125 [Bacteroidales bacterium]|nr:hypothetical protein [Bacteroidales bacterium]